MLPSTLPCLDCCPFLDAKISLPALRFYLQGFLIYLQQLSRAWSPTKGIFKQKYARYHASNDRIRPAIAKNSQKRSLKVHFFEVYRGNNYISYFNLHQKCKDYFATARIKKLNCIPFVASFFQDHISFCRQYQKQELDIESLVLPT